MNKTSELNVVITKHSCAEGQMWVAQCIDKDFAAQGKTLEHAKANFADTIRAHVALSNKFGEKPFENVPDSPKWFISDFENSEFTENAVIAEGETCEQRLTFKHKLQPA